MGFGRCFSGHYRACTGGRRGFGRDSFWDIAVPTEMDTERINAVAIAFIILLLSFPYLLRPLRCRDVPAGDRKSLSPTAFMIFLRLACVGLPVSESIQYNICRCMPACWATAGIRRASATSRRANRNRLSESSAAAFK